LTVRARGREGAGVRDVVAEQVFIMTAATIIVMALRSINKTVKEKMYESSYSSG